LPVGSANSLWLPDRKRMPAAHAPSHWSARTPLEFRIFSSVDLKSPSLPIHGLDSLAKTKPLLPH